MPDREAMSLPRRIRASLGRRWRNWADPRRLRKRLATETPLIDAAWISAQVGRSLDTEAAVTAYLDDPRQLSPHPLFEPQWVLSNTTAIADDADPLVEYVKRRKLHRTVPPHPLIDLGVLNTAHPKAIKHLQGPVSGWLAKAKLDSPLPTPPWAPDITWGEFKDAAFESLEAHRAAARSAGRSRVGSTAPSGDGVESADLQAATLVSVVVVTKDESKALRQTIDSVLRQSYKHLEVVVVDRASSDDTRLVLEGVQAFDSRVKVVDGLPADRTATPAAARNAGAAASGGELLAFIDPGTQWTASFLGSMVGQLQANHAIDIAHAVLKFRDGKKTRYVGGSADHADLLAGGHQFDLGVSVLRNALFETVGGFDESLEGGSEFDFLVRCTEAGPSHFVAIVGADAPRAADDPRSAASTSVWTSAVRSRHLLDWSDAESVSGKVSIVATTSSDDARTPAYWARAVRLSVESGTDTELILTAGDLPRGHRVIVETLQLLIPEVTVVAVGGDVTSSLAANLGVQRAQGETVLISGARVVLTADGIAELVGGLGMDGVALAQPVVVEHDGLVAAAGAAFAAGAQPTPLLAGHAHADAVEIDGRAVPGAWAGPIAVKAATLRSAAGFDASFDSVEVAATDLSMRVQGSTVLRAKALADRRPGTEWGAGVVHDTQRFAELHRGDAQVLRQRTVEALNGAGFAFVGVDNRATDPTAAAEAGPRDEVESLPFAAVTPTTRLDQVTEAPPKLRWTIDLPSPSGPSGERWGDLHFGRSLAGALRRRGQHVAVDPREIRHRSSRDFDDVVLVLRGLDEVRPRTGLVNIEWIISHPDLLTAAEVAPFDLVYAASLSWSAEKSQQWGRPIKPLLQCTDPNVFHPDLAEPDSGPTALFVGNSRGVYRTAVRTAIAAKVDLALYGQSWRQFVPDEAVTGVHVPNNEVGQLYGSAGVVLNDHWEDMRQDGFLSNRLFDAAATGARIATDPIAGVVDVFGGLVRTFSSEAELAELVTHRRVRYPNAAARRELADRVIADHSFDARAEVLLDDAIEAWSARR